MVRDKIATEFYECIKWLHTTMYLHIYIILLIRRVLLRGNIVS